MQRHIGVFSATFVVLSSIFVAPPASAAEGDLITVAGGLGTGPASTTAMRVAGLSLGSGSHILVGDDRAGVIREIDPAIDTQEMIAGTGVRPYDPIEGPASASGIGSVGDVLHDPDSGITYLSDYNVGVVYKIEDGQRTVFVGGADEIGGVRVVLKAGPVVAAGPAELMDLQHPSGLALDEEGNLYVSDSGHDRILRITPDGIATTVIMNGPPAKRGILSLVGADALVACASADHIPHGVYSPQGLDFHDGALYVADYGNDRVLKIENGAPAVIAGGCHQRFDDGGMAIQTTIRGPLDVEISPDGDLYVAQADTEDRVRVIPDASPTGIVTTVAGMKDDGTHVSGIALDVPTSLASDATGIYVGDVRGVLRVSYEGSVTSLTARDPRPAPGDGGVATAAQFENPAAMDLGPDGTLYVADHDAHVVRSVTSDGTISTFAGTGEPGFSGDGGPATEAQLYEPAGLAVGPDGSVFISDGRNRRIRKVSPEGTIETVAGSGLNGGSQPSLEPMIATEAFLSWTHGIAVDDAGNLYIAEDFRVYRVTPDGMITRFAGVQCFNAPESGVPATEANLCNPRDVAVDHEGNVYIAEGDNRGLVRRVDPSGTIHLFAGRPWEEGYSGDGGPAVDALLGRADSIDIAGDGTVYIADSGANVVRAVGADGIIRTVAGTGFSGLSPDGQPAISSKLVAPTAVAVGPEGVFIAEGRTTTGSLFNDDENDYTLPRIRLIEGATAPINTPPTVTLTLSETTISGNATIDIDAFVADPDGIGDLVGISLTVVDGQGRQLDGWGLTSFTSAEDGLAFALDDYRLKGSHPWTLSLSTIDSAGQTATTEQVVTRAG